MKSRDKEVRWRDTHIDGEQFCVSFAKALSNKTRFNLSLTAFKMYLLQIFLMNFSEGAMLNLMTNSKIASAFLAVQAIQVPALIVCKENIITIACIAKQHLTSPSTKWKTFLLRWQNKVCQRAHWIAYNSDCTWWWKQELAICQSRRIFHQRRR